MFLLITNSTTLAGKETRMTGIVFHFFICVKLIPCAWFCYCLTGVGALYVRKRPRVRLEPIINGGGQERGLRSGTVPSTLAVGLGAACSICKQEMDVRISVSWNYLIFFRKWEISNSVLNEMQCREQCFSWSFTSKLISSKIKHIKRTYI